MKARISITIDKKLLKLLDEKVKTKVFANRSHGIEFLIFKDLEEKKEENKSNDKK